jgi:1,4-dihydroxy-6-naphthoate synthase
MELTLGFSPCPNDTFIFDNWVNGKLADNKLHVSPTLADVEQLNSLAKTAELDVTKISFGVYPFIANKYQILDAGSALGFGCGPLLISKREIQFSDFENGNLKVAIPGFSTTANLLLSLAFPKLKNKVEMLFSDIENAVLTGKVDAGLIIHENRFTYQKLGLKKIIDLGEYWENLYNLPIPLGCIVVKRDLSEAMKIQINAAIKKSVEEAFANPIGTMDYVSLHAQTMETSVMQQHIDLYVNKYSISLGNEGHQAIKKLFKVGKENDLFDLKLDSIFAPVA